MMYQVNKNIETKKKGVEELTTICIIVNYLIKGESSNFWYTPTERKVNNFLAKTIYFKDLSSTVTIQKMWTH